MIADKTSAAIEVERGPDTSCELDGFCSCCTFVPANRMNCPSRSPLASPRRSLFASLPGNYQLTVRRRFTMETRTGKRNARQIAQVASRINIDGRYAHGRRRDLVGREAGPRPRPPWTWRRRVGCFAPHPTRDSLENPRTVRGSPPRCRSRVGGLRSGVFRRFPGAPMRGRRETPFLPGTGVTPPSRG